MVDRHAGSGRQMSAGACRAAGGARDARHARRCGSRGFLAVLAAVWVLASALAPAPAGAQEIPVNTGLPERVVVILRDGEELARFTVELALTPEARTIGLMGRLEVPPDRGMLFVWPVLGRPAMWMRNTFVPLDFLFVEPDGTVAGIVHNVPPCPPEGTCPAYPAPTPVNMVLEISGGRAHELGIRPGDRLALLPVDQ